MWRFNLVRIRDVSGKSGVGVIAKGVEFEDGSVALRWVTEYPSTAVWDTVADMMAVHDHNGSTYVSWIDAAPSERASVNTDTDSVTVDWTRFP